MKNGDTLAYIHANDEEKGNKAVEDLYNAYKFSNKEVSKPEHILGIVE